MNEHRLQAGGLRPGFSFMPVAQKELIELAGLRRTYVMRVAFSAGLMLALFATVSTVQSQLKLDPADMIGMGRIVFYNLAFWLFLAVVVLLPGMVATAFPRERYHGTLALLILTGLPAWRIVTEKMLGRLVPMGTLLAATLPLLAVTYALGGLTLNQLASTTYLLVVTCLQVGAFAIMASVLSNTSRGGLARAYGGGLLFVAFVLIVSAPIWILLQGHGIPVAPLLLLLHIYSMKTFAWTVLESVPSVIVAGLCLWNAAACLARAGRPDSSVSDIHHTSSRVGSGSRLSHRLDSLPGDRPLEWRERRYDAAPWYLLLGYVVFLSVALALGALFGSSHEYKGQPAFPVQAVMSGLAILYVILITQQAARAFVSEREHRTLEVLLTTPLSSAEIVRQKAWRLRPLLYGMALVFTVLFGVEAVWETQIREGQAWGLAAYVVSAVLSMLVYGPLCAYLALGLGLRIRSGQTAGLLALGIALAWIILPFPLVDLFRTAADLGSDWNVLKMASPAALFGWMESGAGPMNPWWLITINFTGYGLLLLYLRRHCLRLAGVRLGRVEGVD